MAVSSPEQITAAFQAAYNARDKAALMRLYADDAVHTFDGITISKGLPAISAAFDRGFGGQSTLVGRTLSCLTTADMALLRVHWHSLLPDGTIRHASISCEVLAKGPDGLWRYRLDDATGGSRPDGAQTGG
jgi:ketosteroid isomerase-like protein